MSDMYMDPGPKHDPAGHSMRAGSTTEKEYVTLDSGKRAEFDTGAKRDLPTGKGRFDLIAPRATSVILRCLEYHGDLNGIVPTSAASLRHAYHEALQALAGHCVVDSLSLACGHILTSMGGFAPGMKRLAQLYERGAIKYDARNWEKGIPISRMFDSGLRHLTQAIGLEEDEDHCAGSLFNFVGIIEFDYRIKLGELPDTLYHGMPERWLKRALESEV